MKKTLALILAIVMMAAISIPAFAEDATTTYKEAVTTDTNYSTTTTVEYGVSQTYTVVLPEKVDFGTTKAASATVTVSELIIQGNSKLVVTMDSTQEIASGDDAGKWTMTDKSTGSAAVTYTVTGVAVAADSEKTFVTPTTGNIANAVVSTVEGSEVPATTILEIASNVGGLGGGVELDFATNGTSQAGTYTDTITFGVAIEVVNN